VQVGARGEAEGAAPPIVRHAFLMLLAAWMLTPIAMVNLPAQDATPLYVAGELLPTQPEAVYVPKGGSVFDAAPAFEARSCELQQLGDDCDTFSAAFVSTPLALPAARALALLPYDVAILVQRLLSAAAMCGGMLLLWNRLALDDAAAQRVVLLSALLLLPMVVYVVALGQSSALLFLSALLPPAVAAPSMGRALLWVATVALKGFPAVGGVVLLHARRVRALVAAASMAGLLAVATALVAPASIWTWFLRSSGDLVARAGESRYNGSLESGISAAIGVDAGTIAPAVTLLRVVIVVAALVLLPRVRVVDVRWALILLGSLLLLPQVWWHYLVLAPAAVGIALVHHPRRSELLWVLPVAIGAGVPISVEAARTGPLPALQLVYLVGVVLAAAWLALGDHDDRAPIGAASRDA
jgi:hypothetical protein